MLIYQNCSQIYLNRESVVQKIQPAPKLQELIKKHKNNANLMARVLEVSAEPFSEYRHWHKFKYLKHPPNGLDAETWWMAAKIARNSSKRMLPFEDAQGNKFSYVLTDTILEKLHVIDSDAKGPLRTQQEGQDEIGEQYMLMSLVEESIASSQLEGALTTRKIASNMIRSGRSPQNMHERMIINNYRAMEYIRDTISEPLTFDRLMKLHTLLTRKTLSDSNDCGRIQTQDEERVFIADQAKKVFFCPPPAEQLPNRLEKLIDFATQPTASGQFIHPIIRAIVLHFMIGFDHPFVDGNGRLARAIFYYSVLKSGYDAFAYISISHVVQQAPAQYGYAFQFVETDENDMTYFIHHQLDVICKSITKLREYLAKKREKINQIGTELRKLSLNYRQLALLSHAVRHTGHAYTINSHRNSHSCAYATSRADLLNLVDYGLLEKIFVNNKSLGFVAPQNLNERISQLAKSK